MNTGADILSAITIYSKYSKYLPNLQRRETWSEIVERYRAMMIKKYPELEAKILHYSKWIEEKKILPSMRALQFSGEAVEVNNSRVYNCAYLVVDSIYSFSETMFLLLGGSGVGYSVQKHHIAKLPVITIPTREKRFLIQDDIMGWADAVKALMKAYLGGKARPKFDYRSIRHKGARLVTAGGKAPGHEPLKKCLELVEAILMTKPAGSKLTPLECHDIQCHIANAVLAGGIRRAAMISLFSIDDQEMMAAKSSNVPSNIIGSELSDDGNQMTLDVVQDGIVYNKCVIKIDEKTGKFWDIEQYNHDGTLGWWVCNEQRGRANNSVILLRGTITEEQFKDIWVKVKASGSGEPGVYWTNDLESGTNPCCEVALNPNQFCNLCEVNASDVSSQLDLNQRVMAAAFFGTLQAGFTDFHYLRSIWKKTTEAEALLGVGMTGIGSGEILKYDLSHAAELVNLVNTDTAQKIGINPAARTTLVKPAGTTSCVLKTSSGIHAWHDDYFLRTVRYNRTEDIALHMIVNHPHLVEDDQLRSDTVCVRIPMKAPEGSILRHEHALDTLERVAKFSREWITPGHNIGINSHNVSATISIKNEEWEAVGNWMWDNKEFYNGLSVLPYDGGTYIQAPFETISKEEYERRFSELTPIDLTSIIEVDDHVQFNQEAACAGGKCEI